MDNFCSCFKLSSNIFFASKILYMAVKIYPLAPEPYHSALKFWTSLKFILSK